MAWVHVQSASTVVGSGNPDVAYGTNVTSGNKLIAMVSLDSSEAGDVALDLVCTIADGSGNQMTFLNGAVESGSYTGMFAMDVPSGDAGAKPSITATIDASLNNFGVALLIQEVSGLAVGNTIAAMLDGTVATNTGSGSTAASGSYMSSVASEYLVFTYGDPGSGASISTPSLWTPDPNNPADNNDAELAVFYKNSAGSSESASSTIGTSTPWMTLIVAFKLAAPPAGVPPPFYPRPSGRVVTVPFCSGRRGAAHSQ